MKAGKAIVFLIIFGVAAIMVVAATEPWLIYEARDRISRALKPYLPTIATKLPEKVTPARAPLTERLAERGFRLGTAVFIRIHKVESELEVWLEKGPRYELFEVFSICRWSGDLGPKLQQGDRQAPEGFYQVSRRQLNPNSAHHLSFNLGYPNAYDRSHGRTGSALMVHGGCSSAGCYAMTDAGIDDIYSIVEAALAGGQRTVPVLALPFRMSAENVARHQDSRWSDFWSELKIGNDMFEQHRRPPAGASCGKRYVFGTRPGPGCAAIAGW